MIRIALSGYEHMRVGRANVLAATPVATAVREIVERETLYHYASRAEEKVVLHGRAPVYVIPFGALRVAVRHVMRGGGLAPLLRDRFLPPTRVLRELVNAVRLQLSGVHTPDVLAVVIYPAGGLFRRADVMTHYMEGIDLAAVLSDARNDAQRRPILDAVAALLARMAAAGAQHSDLNLKNVLITSTSDGYTAAVLDVDRVHFHVPNDPLVARANLERLLRSLRKWRAHAGTRAGALLDDDLDYLTLATAVQPA